MSGPLDWGQRSPQDDIAREMPSLQVRSKELHAEVARVTTVAARRSLQKMGKEREGLLAQINQARAYLSGEAAAGEDADALTDEQKQGMLRVKQQLLRELKGLPQRKERVTRTLTLQLAALSSLLESQVSSDLNDASAFFFSPHNLCMMGDLGVAMLGVLSSPDLARVKHVQLLGFNVRNMLKQVSWHLANLGSLITQHQVDQLKLCKVIMAAGEYQLLYNLWHAGLIRDLNPSTGSELTSLQRLCSSDSITSDHRFLLMFVQLGLDPSDANLAHPERLSAIQIARATAQSPEAANVQPMSQQEWYRAPRSIIGVNSLPSGAADMQQQGHQQEAPEGSEEGKLLAAQTVSPRIRFCVDLVAAWRDASLYIVERLFKFLQPLESEVGVAKSSDTPPAPASGLLPPPLVALCIIIADYLDLSYQMQLNPEQS